MWLFPFDTAEQNNGVIDVLFADAITLVMIEAILGKVMTVNSALPVVVVFGNGEVLLPLVTQLNASVHRVICTSITNSKKCIIISSTAAYLSGSFFN